MVPALHRMTPADFMDCDAKYRNVFTSTDTHIHIRIMCIVHVQSSLDIHVHLYT